MPRAVRRATTRVAGVDGCRGGWVVATDGDVFVAPTIDEVLALDVAVIAIDMPIGLPEAGQRACDVAARKLLGPRRSSVFATPVRATLAATSYAEALALHRGADGRGLSKQAYNLLPKIRELDANAADARLHESHPELAFARLLGHPAEHPKRSPAGRAERLGVLGLTAISRLPAAAADDVLDALALVHTARHIAAGTGNCLGDGARDARETTMAVWA
jgi:predicted RNase H-like nuclease